MNEAVRKFLPHVLVVVAGVACLAMIWHFEPPIRSSNAAWPAKTTPNSNDLDFWLATDRDQELTQIVVKLAWDKRSLAVPRVSPAEPTGGWRTFLQPGDGEMSVMLSAAGGRPPQTAENHTLRRIARVTFSPVNAEQPVDPNAVGIVETHGVDAAGHAAPVEGLELLGPDRRSGPAAPRNPNR